MSSASEYTRYDGYECVSQPGGSTPPSSHTDAQKECSSSPTCSCFSSSSSSSSGRRRTTFTVHTDGHSSLRAAAGASAWLRVGRIEIPSYLRSRRCDCGFGVCTPQELASFMLRLPTSVKRRSSSIYAYLRTVYRTDELELPYSLDRLEAFYPRLLPVQPCSVARRPATRSHASHLSPVCSKLCSEWLAKPTPAAEAVASFMRNRSFIRVVGDGSDGDSPSLYPFSQIVAFQPPPSLRKLRKHAWVEVTRFADTHSPRMEGSNGYGCWFYPARGTGVWVHTGSSLVWPTWMIASREVREATGKRRYDDSPFAQFAATRRHDSFQIKRSHGRVWGWHELNETAPSHELVIVRPECMNGTRRLRGCIPGELRTGPNASAHCACDASHHDLLQCAGTPLFTTSP